nr:immunoglobulin light chain junction region [Macaca mulatta]MOY05615.1 immunoglobulin light chain junction region [Macaca mulatta]MOY05980.1 immunoglobulin light chain junction region [Macaca mulatta]MOY06155.1 immunoglobulin light chain junction region [Macaca mulatta]MOY06467.1 immunoglobulin light chain junction region [Macaca mulatta]
DYYCQSYDTSLSVVLF